jgi:hypothetical protein
LHHYLRLALVELQRAGDRDRFAVKRRDIGKSVCELGSYETGERLVRVPAAHVDEPVQVLGCSVCRNNAFHRDRLANILCRILRTDDGRIDGGLCECRRGQTNQHEKQRNGFHNRKPAVIPSRLYLRLDTA